MQDQNALTDEELLAVADDPTLKAKMTPAEIGRLSALRSGSQKPARTWTDTAVDALPAIGGTLGGIVGGIGGTAFGAGIGGVPGAMGGAALGGGAGEAARQLVNRARGAEAPATPAAAAGDIALQGGINGALEGVGQAVGPMLTKGAQAVYRGYLKPSLAAKNLPKADQIVRTAIDEALPVTASGFQQAGKVIAELNAEADRILQSSPGKVDIHDVADKLRTWAQRTYNRPGRAPADFEAAMKVADRIDAHPSITPTPPNAPVTDVSAAAANQIKRDMQSGASSAYGVKSGAEKTAEKTGASMLRQGVEQAAPEVGPVNARESKLIDVARALERATGREGNLSKTYGVRALVGGTVGAEEYKRTGDPYSATAKAAAMAAGMHPAVATRAAILAAKIGERMPGQAPAAVARAAVQAISESQQPEE
jgi:hypothetical protein